MKTIGTKTYQRASAKRKGHVQPKAPVVDLSQPGWLRTCHVLALTGWSHSTLENRIKSGQFPEPLKNGRLNTWTTATVRGVLLADCETSVSR